MDRLRAVEMLRVRNNLPPAATGYLSSRPNRCPASAPNAFRANWPSLCPARMSQHCTANWTGDMVASPILQHTVIVVSETPWTERSPEDVTGHHESDRLDEVFRSFSKLLPFE